MISSASLHPLGNSYGKDKSPFPFPEEEASSRTLGREDRGDGSYTWMMGEDGLGSFI